jgi:HK97 gp10 family phage protein
MRVTFDTSELSDIINDLSRFQTAKTQEVKDVIHESALNIQKGAKRRCPVDTGRLRASIAFEPVGQLGLTMQVGTKVKYAPYVEWGTGVFASLEGYQGRQTPWRYPATRGGALTGEFVYTRGSKPHPFLIPAFEEEKPRFIRAVREALDR